MKLKAPATKGESMKIFTCVMFTCYERTVLFPKIKIEMGYVGVSLVLNPEIETMLNIGRRAIDAV